MKKRDLFAELMQGVDEMAAQREGKITLRKSKPNAQAALLIRQVEKFPDMVERLQAV
jgi:putative transcriptional regulator